MSKQGLACSILHRSCGFHLRTSWMRFHPRVGENFIETCHRVTIKHSQAAKHWVPMEQLFRIFEVSKLPLLHPPSPAHQTGYQLLLIQPWNYRCVQLKPTAKLKEGKCTSISFPTTSPMALHSTGGKWMEMVTFWSLQHICIAKAYHFKFPDANPSRMGCFWHRGKPSAVKQVDADAGRRKNTPELSLTPCCALAWSGCYT